MDIRWKDLAGNIINADSKSIKYYDAKDDVKTVLNKEEVMKIIMEDGLMHFFRDFEDNDLALTIVIPRKQNRAAVKIFNAYDKTGKMLKRKTGNFFLDLILESCVILYNPILGIVAILCIASLLLLGLIMLIDEVFGDFGIAVVRILIIGYLAYIFLSYIYVRINRKIIAKDSKSYQNKAS